MHAHARRLHAVHVYLTVSYVFDQNNLRITARFWLSDKWKKTVCLFCWYHVFLFQGKRVAGIVYVLYIVYYVCIVYSCVCSVLFEQNYTSCSSSTSSFD